GIEVELGDRFRALTVGHAEAVGGGVTTTDDDHVFASGVHRRDRRPAGDHSVGGDEVLHRQVDAGQGTAWGVWHVAAGERPARQQHRVVVGAQRIAGDVHADVDAGAEGDTLGLQLR